VPTVDQVVAVMAELTDPDKPAASKTDIVTPGFTPDEAGTIDDHLNRTNAAGLLPYNFVVTFIQPAPNNFAGVTVTVTGSFNQRSAPGMLSKPVDEAYQAISASCDLGRANGAQLSGGAPVPIAVALNIFSRTNRWS
jgi:hypothetical protein